MSDIGPGDWVEFIGSVGGDHLRIGGAVAAPGSIWRVSACGDWRGSPWLMAGGLPHPREFDPRWSHVPGWDATDFRPVYRPKSDIIEALKRPELVD